MRTATKKVGGFLSGHSCHPLGWQNCREGGVRGQQQLPVALPLSSCTAGSTLPYDLGLSTPVKGSDHLGLTVGQGPCDTGHGPRCDMGTKHPARQARHPFPHLSSGISHPVGAGHHRGASVLEDQVPATAGPPQSTPNLPARCPGGTGCPPSPSLGSAAGSGPGLPHSLRTGADGQGTYHLPHLHPAGLRGLRWIHHTHPRLIWHQASFP